jgi:malonyl-CoA/methylmalonyl-CoA synthetase
VPNHLHDALFAPGRSADAPLLHLDDDRTVTRGAFAERVSRFSAALRSLGAAPGDRVAVQVEKSADALALSLACVHGGFVLLPLNPAYTAAEVDYFVGDASPAILVGADEALLEVAVAHGAAFASLGADGSGSLPPLVDASAPVDAADRAPGDLAAILYTSGTTGRSKGAMLTHHNLLVNARTLTDLWRFGEGDVLLHALPVFHTHGLFVAVNVALLSGAAMVFLPRFDVGEVLRRFPEVTTMMGVPTFYTRLLASPAFEADLVAHMRLFVSGSAPMLPETHEAFTARTGHSVLERYGMTETGMLTSNPYDDERRPGTVGRPLPGVDLRVCDVELGEPVEPGATGVVEVRGPNVFAGYWRRPEKTAEEFRDDGYFATGDLGRLDPDGYLELVGRAKDLVIAGGFNVYPREVEAEIDALPEVLESAVIGVPHADLGEAVVAVVVPARGAIVEPNRIVQALAARLARFKCPREVVAVDELPRNTMGKVQKAELRRRFADVFEP